MTRPARQETRALEFRSKEDFRALCRQSAMRLNSLNRTAMGEQKFVWHLAETLQNLWQVFDEGHDDPEIRALFGDGCEAGKLDRDQAAA